MKMITLSVVIPIYNERKSLRELISQVQRAINAGTTECICVDDGSTDGSFEELKRVKQKSKLSMILIKLRKHSGKSAALAVGFSYTRSNTIVTLDADLQDDPDDIPTLLAKLDKGFDLVTGWRVNRRDSWQKRFLSKIFNYVVSYVSGIHIHDFNVGLKAYRRAVVAEIRLYGDLHRYIPLLAAARGFRVTEVPISHHRRRYGRSKFGLGRVIHGGFDFLTTMFIISFQKQPLQLFGPLGAITSLVGFIILMYLTYLRISGESIGRRPLLFLGMLLVLFGVQLISTGLIAELLTHYYHTDQEYPVDEVIA